MNGLSAIARQSSKTKGANSVFAYASAPSAQIATSAKARDAAPRPESAEAAKDRPMQRAADVRVHQVRVGLGARRGRAAGLGLRSLGRLLLARRLRRLAR